MLPKGDLYVFSTLLLGILLQAGETSAQRNISPRAHLPELQVRVRSADGDIVLVKGPEVDLDDSGEPYYNWTLTSLQKSPDGRFIAIHYSGSRPKYWHSVVYLVNPSGQILELKNSIVRKTLWSQDSKYLLGFGDNTFRVWNLLGHRRQLTFGEIVGFDYRGSTICLRLRESMYQEGNFSSIETVKVFSIPQLKLLNSKSASNRESCSLQWIQN